MALFEDVLPGGLALRRNLGYSDWSAPIVFPGNMLPTAPQSGWAYRSVRSYWSDSHDKWLRRSILISAEMLPEDGFDVAWIHASITGEGDNLPSYDDMVLLHRAVFGDRFAYQVFAPQSEHVNIHNTALHLWGRADGSRLTPAAQEVNGKLSI